MRINNIVTDLREYVSINQELQQLLNRKEFLKVDNILKEIRIHKENKFMIIQLLRQTFPHKHNLSLWQSKYETARKDLNITPIQTYKGN